MIFKNEKQRINKSTLNTHDLEYNTPVLFQKKSKKIIDNPITYIKNDTGMTRHYTPASQEWFNSVYSYNQNYVQTLPVADTTLMKLLKGYFNLQIKPKLLKMKRIATRYKRSSTKRIFVGRGDLKHTSSKVIITFFVHNAEKFFLSQARNRMYSSLYYPKKALTIFVNKNIKDKELITYQGPFTTSNFFFLHNLHGDDIITYNRLLTLHEYRLLLLKDKRSYFDLIIKWVKLQNLHLRNIILQYNILTKMVNMKIISQQDKNRILSSSILFFNVQLNRLKYLEILEFQNMRYYNYIFKNFRRYNYLLGFNKVKFTKPFMFKLTRLVENIYNKKVVFNIVNLKKMHQNTDIYTQLVSLKLRNRNNKLNRVLKSSIRKVKLPFMSRLSEKVFNFNRDNLHVNMIRNKYISSMFNTNVNDPLSKLLLDFFPSTEKDKVINSKNSLFRNGFISLTNYVLNSIKHLKIRGIRVEAKGRLTRRFTASRSVFKMRCKGGLKNVDSSFKGISTIMLRGYAKSNVQHSFISSKNRNGAFGVKGWVSSK